MESFFRDLVEKVRSKGSDACRIARKSLQRNITSVMHGKIDSLRNYIGRRMRRWGDQAKEHERFEKESSSMLSARNLLSDKQRWAWLDFWLNGFFTARRIKQESCPCLFCAHIVKKGIRTADQDGEDSIDHMRCCLVIILLGGGPGIHCGPMP